MNKIPNNSHQGPAASAASGGNKIGFWPAKDCLFIAVLIFNQPNPDYGNPPEALNSAYRFIRCFEGRLLVSVRPVSFDVFQKNGGGKKRTQVKS